jgi:hypothetical protein
MDDDTTRRGFRDDDPEATGAMWPLPDDELADGADDDLTRPRAGRSAESPASSVGSRRRAAAPFDRAPDEESTYVLSASAAARGADRTRVAPDSGRDWLDQALPETPAPVRARAGRPRPRRSGPAWPRIIAPIVLLAAVLAVVTLSVQSGVIGGPKKTAATHPATKASHVATTKKYVYYRVRKGDTMSTIAAKYNISLSALMGLNPRASSSTLAIGQKLKVPNPR